MKKILIIEDDIALRENTAELLELSNYEVITAPNGRVGVQRAKTEAPDIIICDIMMPELDGYGVLKSLSENETTTQIPFVFLSARTEHKEIRLGMNMGADDYLTKPYEESDLISAIESRLAKSQLLKNLPENGVQELSNEGVRNLNELKNFFDDSGSLEKYKKGEVIYEEGDHANKVYLVLKGVIKSHSMDENGKELITALYKADDFLGFTSFLDHHPHQETSTALEDSVLVGITKSELHQILGNSQKVSLELMELLADNLSGIKEQLLQMAYSSVRKKTAQTIIQFAQIMSHKQEEGIKISRNDLASVAGIASESLIRALSVLKKRNLISIDGRNIKILDLDGLKQVD